MRRSAFKWAAIGGLIVIILLYGVEAATTGIGKIYGPLERQDAMSGSVYDKASNTTPAERLREDLAPLQRLAEPAAPYEESVTSIERPENRSPINSENSRQNGEQNGQVYRPAGDGIPIIPPRAGEAGVDRIADGTAGLLQSVSSNGIRFLVSVFDAITG